MKTASHILLSSLALFAMLSCNATRRAERRVERIASRHPEITRVERITMDTVVRVAPRPDTACFTDNVPAGDTAVMRGMHGTFKVFRLDGRRTAVVYVPEPDSVRVRKSVPVRLVTVRKRGGCVRMAKALCCVAALMAAELILKTRKK